MLNYDPHPIEVLLSDQKARAFITACTTCQKIIAKITFSDQAPLRQCRNTPEQRVDPRIRLHTLGLCLKN